MRGTGGEIWSVLHALRASSLQTQRIHEGRNDEDPRYSYHFYASPIHGRLLLRLAPSLYRRDNVAWAIRRLRLVHGLFASEE
jgi:hypothetical protein